MCCKWFGILINAIVLQKHLGHLKKKSCSKYIEALINASTSNNIFHKSAVSVEVKGGRTLPFCVTFNSYRAGDAPCRVDNMCSDLHLKVNQREQGQVTLVSPQHSLLYTWDDPCADRTLVWNVYNNKGIGFPMDIHTDGYGEVRIRLHTVKPGTVNVSSPPPTATPPPGGTTAAAASSSSDTDSSSEEHNQTQQPSVELTKKTMRRDKVVVYWLCYIDGPQRTVMFTQDHRLAIQYRRRMLYERCDWEVMASLSGIGISLVLSQPTPIEFAFASLTDSPALWEVNIAHKWKMLTLELAAWVEDKYKTHQKKCQLKDYVYIDFEKMYMLKPFYGELRRTYYPAISLQYRHSDTQQFYHLKINTIQVEAEPHTNNQYKILQPLIGTTTKPFGVPCIELTCLKRHCLQHDYDVYKRLIFDVYPELYINVDRVLIERLLEMIGPWLYWITTLGLDEPAVKISTDMALVHAPLSAIVQNASGLNTGKRIIIEQLRLAPITLQLNITQYKYDMSK